MSNKIIDYRNLYDFLKNGEKSGDIQKLSGRIVSKRESGSKLCFYDIEDYESKVQIICNEKEFENTNINFKVLHNNIRRGDIIGAVGNPYRSNSGELSLYSKDLYLLSPCLNQLPLDIVDTSQRPLSLLVSRDLKDTLKIRSSIVQNIRSFFIRNNYTEVSTNVLNDLPSGAVASPFITKSNETKDNLYLRISPEIPLKTLIISGYDRIFEIGKVFRNEHKSFKHIPEFTSLEAYCAYQDMPYMMKLTEDLLRCNNLLSPSCNRGCL